MTAAVGTDTQKKVKKIGEWLLRGSTDGNKIFAALSDLQKLDINGEILELTKIQKVVEPFCKYADVNVARKATKLIELWNALRKRPRAAVKQEIVPNEELHDVKPARNLNSSPVQSTPVETVVSRSTRRKVSFEAAEVLDVKPDVVVPAEPTSRAAKSAQVSGAVSSHNLHRKRGREVADEVDLKPDVPSPAKHGREKVNEEEDTKPMMATSVTDCKPKVVRYADIDLFAVNRNSSSKKKQQKSVANAPVEKVDEEKRGKRAKLSAPSAESTSRAAAPSLPNLLSKPVAADFKLTPADFAELDVDLLSPTVSSPDMKPSFSSPQSSNSKALLASTQSPSSSGSKRSDVKHSAKRRPAQVKQEDDLGVFVRKKSSGAHLFLAGGQARSHAMEIDYGVGRVPSLVECCQRVLIRFADAIEYVGACPFALLEDAVKRLTPEQLERFDSFNPQLRDDTKACWKELVQRTFRADFEAGKARRRHGETWSGVYRRLVSDRERRLKQLAAAARCRINGAQSAERTARVTNEIRLPPEVARRAIAEPLDPIATMPIRSASGRLGLPGSRPSSSHGNATVSGKGSPIKVLPARSYSVLNGMVVKKSSTNSNAPMMKKTFKLARSCGGLNAYRKSMK